MKTIKITVKKVCDDPYVFAGFINGRMVRCEHADDKASCRKATKRMAENPWDYFGKESIDW